MRTPYHRNRRNIAFLLIFILFCNIQCNNNQASPDQPITPLKRLDQGNLILKFDMDDEMSPVYKDRLTKYGVLNSVIRQLNDQFILPRDINITFGNIGQENAFYNYETKSISFGYEFVNAFEYVFMKEYKSEQEALDATRNTVIFFLLHELGHALIDIYQIPISGNPEDVADNFSINLLTETEGVSDAAIQGASFFQILTKYETDVQLKDLPVLDVHLLNPQRFHNIICKLYGSDPEKYQSLITLGYMEESDSQGCVAGYESMKKAWTRDLDPWLK